MHSRRHFLRAFIPGTLTVATGLERGLEAWHRLLSQSAGFKGTPRQMAEQEAFWLDVQQAFTVDRSLIHLNNGGVCPAPAMVQRALQDHQYQTYKQPFYRHRSLLRPQIEQIRHRLARMFGCDSEEIALTRNTSEGMEICQLGLNLNPGDEVLTTMQDYPRMINTWHQRKQRDGIVLKQISLPVPAEDPVEIVSRFEAEITPRTRLIMLCHMIDLTGQIMPVAEVVEMAHQKGIPVLVDGAQTFGHLAFDSADLRCDLYATSLHKWLMGPHGTGMLYVRRDHIQDVWPLMPSDPELKDDVRKFEDIGTDEWARWLAVSEALTFHHGIGAERKEARLRYLRRYWVDPLLHYDRLQLRTSLDSRFSCGLTTIQIEGIDPVELRDYLWNEHRIIVRPIKHEAVEGIRVSPSLYTTLDELDRFVEVIERVIKYGITT